MFKFAIRFHDETSAEGDLGLGEVRGALPVAGRLVQNACEKGHPGLGVVLGAARVAGELVQNAACAKGAGTAVGHQPCRLDMAVDIVALFRQALEVQVGLNERARHGPERDKGQRVAEAIGLLCESFIEWAPRLDEEEMELYLARAQGVLAGRVAEAAKDSNGREEEDSAPGPKLAPSTCGTADDLVELACSQLAIEATEGSNARRGRWADLEPDGGATSDWDRPSVPAPAAVGRRQRRPKQRAQRARRAPGASCAGRAAIGKGRG